MAKKRKNKISPWISHFVVFLGGVVVGVLIQPFFVPDTKPQVFLPDEVMHPAAVHTCNCPQCSKCPEIPEIPACPQCPACNCPECPVCTAAAAVQPTAKLECPSCGEKGSCPKWFNQVTQDYLPGRMQELFPKSMEAGWWYLGCKADVDQVLDLLKPFYQGPDKDGVFVDIGANLGQVSENLVQSFGNIPWRQYQYKFGLKGMYCEADPNPGLEVFMFEPQPNNAKRITERAELNNWKLEKMNLIQAAVSNYTGSTEFKFSGEFTETGTLGDCADDNGCEVVKVEVVKFDDAYKQHMNNRKIFMMKTDTEGFDGTVVRGMHEVLASGKLRFLSFEYHNLWFEMGTGDTLRSTLDILEGYGYFCYYILPRRLYPISGRFWRPEYEIKRWSNVFCGQEADFLLEKLVIMYHIASTDKKVETNQYMTKEDAMKFFFKGD